MVRLPELSVGQLVRDVDPSMVPRRDYYPAKFKLDDLMNKVAERTGYQGDITIMDSSQEEEPLDDMYMEDMVELDYDFEKHEMRDF
jgi:hypothetical protein